MPVDPQQLAEHVARLEGTLDGALITLRWGQSLIGGLLMLLIASIIYSFQRLTRAVDGLQRRSNKLVSYYNSIAAKLGLPPYSNGD